MLVIVLCRLALVTRISSASLWLVRESIEFDAEAQLEQAQSSTRRSSGGLVLLHVWSSLIDWNHRQRVGT